jgi:molybdopterin-guanine dinucleotide biosynthesis protein A
VLGSTRRHLISYAALVDEIVAAVLTGGKSTRMGAPKAAITIDGVTMGEYVARSLATFRTLAVGAPLGELPTIPDASGAGPLAGIAAALAIEANAVFVTAVDHPWLQASTVAAMVQRFDMHPVVPIDGGRRQVTCAIYPTALAAKAAELAERGAAIQALLDDETVDEVLETEWRAWGEDGRSWFSVDSMGDLELGLSRFGRPQP